MTSGLKRNREDRLRSAMAYVESAGSSIRASKLLQERGFDIPARTIRDMTVLDEWPSLISIAHDALDKILDAEYTHTIHAVNEILRNRLEFGDVVFDKLGNERRKPVSARDAAWIGAVFKDKRNAGRGLASKIIKNVTISEHFNNIKKELATVIEVEEKEQGKRVH